MNIQASGSPKRSLSEIVFVVILLILALGILNYFNVLPLSTTFPNQLGFLPRNQFMQTQDQNTSTSVKPTLVPYMTADLSSREKEMEALLAETLPNIIYKQLAPDKSKITTTSNKTSKVLTSTWIVNGISGTAAFSSAPDGKSISDIYVSFSDNKAIAPSKETAPRLTSAYFSFKPKGIWGCKSTSGTNMTYCENYWEEDLTKKGIGIQQLSSSEGVVFFCQHSKESGLYAWKSCSSEFAETGVQ